MDSAKKGFILSGIIYFFISILYELYPTNWLALIELLVVASFILLLLWTYTSFTTRRYIHLFIALVILVPAAFRIIYRIVS
ncbi:hypothetical protein MKY30_03645 [Oceanobacillus sp. FSL W8-0428]|uniref:Uncharacterized protein n=1 Tax=Oceanobacillus sojae TaxID=582851 RepID=A0A511ZN59_9BACI|nr:hypothetical protein [Oceanobacillus sojae]GEN88884.1 hypothetical protein OSO01_36230 [Oceanobacillus sojae]